MVPLALPPRSHPLPLVSPFEVRADGCARLVFAPATATAGAEPPPPQPQLQPHSLSASLALSLRLLPLHDAPPAAPDTASAPAPALALAMSLPDAAAAAAVVEGLLRAAAAARCAPLHAPLYRVPIPPHRSRTLYAGVTMRKTASWLATLLIDQVPVKLPRSACALMSRSL